MSELRQVRKINFYIVIADQLGEWYFLKTKIKRTGELNARTEQAEEKRRLMSELTAEQTKR